MYIHALDKNKQSKPKKKKIKTLKKGWNKRWTTRKLIEWSRKLHEINMQTSVLGWLWLEKKAG